MGKHHKVWVAPGNPGIAESFPVLKLTNSLLEQALHLNIDLVVFGPETALADGTADRFRAAGLYCFGPSAAAAEIESSKSFSKKLMRKAGIPTADFAIFDDFSKAQKHLHNLPSSVVIKASGLAAGKGAFVCESKEEAESTLRALMVDSLLGKAGDTCIIEERLLGPELSIFAMSDGKEFLVLPPTRDFKRLRNGNHGPNTGGMGAVSHPKEATSDLLRAIADQIIRPCLAALRAQGRPFIGTLYSGVILSHKGPKVLEFNCRFGDPETQALLPLICEDLGELMLACAQGNLETKPIHIKNKVAVNLVAAANGYPHSAPRGDEIFGLDSLDEDLLLFHSGTRKEGERWLTNGGRVFSISALGHNHAAAASRARQGMSQAVFRGQYYRSDIGENE